MKMRNVKSEDLFPFAGKADRVLLKSSASRKLAGPTLAGGSIRVGDPVRRLQRHWPADRSLPHPDRRRCSQKSAIGAPLRDTIASYRKWQAASHDPGRSRRFRRGMKRYPGRRGRFVPIAIRRSYSWFWRMSFGASGSGSDST